MARGSPWQPGGHAPHSEAPGPWASLGGGSGLGSPFPEPLRVPVPPELLSLTSGSCLGPGQEQFLPGGLVGLPTQGRALPGSAGSPSGHFSLAPSLLGSGHRAVFPAFLLCEGGAAHWPCSSPGDSGPTSSGPRAFLLVVVDDVQPGEICELLPSPEVSQDPLGPP